MFFAVQFTIDATRITKSRRGELRLLDGGPLPRGNWEYRLPQGQNYQAARIVSIKNDKHLDGQRKRAAGVSSPCHEAARLFGGRGDGAWQQTSMHRTAYSFPSQSHRDGQASGAGHQCRDQVSVWSCVGFVAVASLKIYSAT